MTMQRLYSGQDVIVTNPMAERAGCRGHLYATSSDGYGSVEFPDGMLEKYRLSALSAAPTLKLGDRVKTTQDSRPSWLRGKEGVVTDWGEDAEPDSRYTPVVMDCDPDDVWYFEADELELLPEPKRVPTAGEVWGFQASPSLTQQPIYLINKALVNLNDHSRVPCNADTLAWVADSPAWTFLASDLASYFKGLL